jgi:hypothetical protein
LEFVDSRDGIPTKGGGSPPHGSGGPPRRGNRPLKGGSEPPSGGKHPSGVEEDFKPKAQVCFLVLHGQVLIPLEPMVATMVFAIDTHYLYGSFLKEIVVLYVICSIGTNSN